MDLKSFSGEIGFNSLPYGDPGQSAGMASGRNRGKDILHQVSGLGPSKPTVPHPSACLMGMSPKANPEQRITSLHKNADKKKFK